MWNSIGRRCTCGAETEHICGMGACFDLCPNCGDATDTSVERDTWRTERRLVRNVIMLVALIAAILTALAVLFLPTPAAPHRLRHPPLPPQRPAEIGERGTVDDALRREPVLPIEREPALHCRIFPILPGCP